MAETTESLQQRIAELEVRYMHQQAWMDDLNQVVREQSDLIIRLQQQLERMKDTLSERTTEEKPPHY